MAEKSMFIVYTVLQINLLSFKFFGSTGAPAFLTFNQLKCTVKLGNAPLWLVESLESQWLSSAPEKSYSFAD